MKAKPVDGQTRRSVMTSLAGLSLGGAMSTSVRAADRRLTATGSSILVAFFSRSGNTRVVAGLLRRATGADLFEIQPAVSYPDEYLATVEQARVERDNGYRPALAATVPDIKKYEKVFLGFPIWGETTPPVIRSFLSSHDFAGTTIVPFITHGGYGLGDSLSVIARHAPRARLAATFSMQADQERQTMEKVSGWLRKVPVV